VLGGGRPAGASIREVLCSSRTSFQLLRILSKMVITRSSKVEMICHLLGWNLDFKKLPLMHHLAPVSSRDGTNLDMKLTFLSVRNMVPTLTSRKRRGLSLNGRC
jgi:hypothetical protein